MNTSDLIKSKVQRQCAWILENHPKLNYDKAEQGFLSGDDRSTDATGQMQYLAGIITRHYLTLPRHLTDYVAPEVDGYAISYLMDRAQDAWYYETRLQTMAAYGRDNKAPVSHLYHWVNDDGRSLLMSKEDMFEWCVREYLSVQNINKIINRTRNVEKGWRLVQA